MMGPFPGWVIGVDYGYSDQACIACVSKKDGVITIDWISHVPSMRLGKRWKRKRRMARKRRRGWA